MVGRETIIQTVVMFIKIDVLCTEPSVIHLPNWVYFSTCGISLHTGRKFPLLFETLFHIPSATHTVKMAVMSDDRFTKEGISCFIYRLAGILCLYSCSRYAHAIQTMIHVIQQRQFLPWLMPDSLFWFSSLKKDYDDSLSILHTFTKSVIKGN